MAPKKPNTSWLVWLLKVAVVTTISFGAAWGGSKLWSYFSPPSAPHSFKVVNPHPLLQSF